MNPMKYVEPLGRLASKIASHLDLDATCIVTFDGGTISCFFGSRKEFSRERMADLLNGVADNFKDTAEKVANGEIRAEEMEESQGGEIKFFHKKWPTDQDDFSASV